MAKIKTGGGIYKRSNGRYFFKIVLNGKEIRKSLNTNKKSEALRLAKQLSESLLDVKDKSSVVEKFAEIKGIANTEQIQELKEDFNRVSNRKLLILDAFDEYFTEIKKQPSEGTKEAYERNWRDFTEFIAHQYPEISSLSQIKKDHVISFGDHLFKTRSEDGFNRTIKFCRRLFKVLKSRADLSDNPFDLVQTITAVKKHSKKELTEEQVLAISEEIENPEHHREVKTLFIIGLFTGLRLKDSCLLTWESINLKIRVAKLKPFKTQRYDKTIELPILDTLYCELLEAKKWSDSSGYVCPFFASQYLRSKASLTSPIKKVFESAGIKTSLKIEGRQGISLYGFHSLRYTFVSLCAQKGVPMAIVQSLVGHSTLQMTSHYTKIDMKTKAEALKVLGMEQKLNREDIIALVESMDMDNWQEIRRQILDQY